MPLNGLDPETRRNEARRAESEVGFLGKEQRAPLLQLGVCGSAVSSPSGVRDGAPDNLDFVAFWDVRNHVRTVSFCFESGGNT